MTNTPVDWSKPIETDEAVPRPLVVGEHNELFSRRWVHLKGSLDSDNEGMWVDDKGTPILFTKETFAPGIRNVQPARPEVTPELVERMVGLARMASGEYPEMHLVADEARAILAALNPEPVDPLVGVFEAIIHRAGDNTPVWSKDMARLFREEAPKHGLTITGDEG